MSNIFEPSTALEQWIKIIRQRSSFLSARGVLFLQIVVPEKQTIMSNLYPLVKPMLTPTLLGLNHAFSASDFYINAYDLLSCLYLYKGLDPYRRGDTHLTIFGYMELAAAVAGRYCSKTQSNILSGLNFEHASFRGDLLTKFYGKENREKVLITSSNAGIFKGKCKCSEFVQNQGGKKSGIRAVYTNSLPHIDKKNLLVGNSMCERGVHPLGLTWWFLRIFARVEFIWSPNVSYALIESDPPDIVISQNVERFLPVPARS